MYLVMPEYAGICVDMPKSACMAFVVLFPIAFPCPLEMHGYLFQRLNETGS